MKIRKQSITRAKNLFKLKLNEQEEETQSQKAYLIKRKNINSLLKPENILEKNRISELKGKINSNNSLKENPSKLSLISSRTQNLESKDESGNLSKVKLKMNKENIRAS